MTHAHQTREDASAPLDYPLPEKLTVDPRLAELREHCPVAQVALPGHGSPAGQATAWLVTRHDLATQMLANPTTFSRALAASQSPGLREAGQFIVDLDAPDHTRIRRTVQECFKPANLERMRPRIREVTRQLVRAMIAEGSPADLIRHLSVPLPITIIGELLNVPANDRPKFTGWAEAFVALSSHTPQQVAEAQLQLNLYVAELFTRHRERYTADELEHGQGGTQALIPLLLKAQADGVLSEQEMVNLGVIIIVAGYETTANAIGAMTYTLLQRPALWSHLLRHRDDLRAVGLAVEELLRMVPLGSMPPPPRAAVHDVEFGGAMIRAGDVVAVAHDTACARDPRVFPNPEKIRLDRDPNPHLAFGHGPHYCLGAGLARIELQEALRALADMLPGLRLAVPAEELDWQSGGLVRGLRTLPVTWS